MDNKQNQQHTAMHDMLKLIRTVYLQYNTVSMGRRYINFYYALLSLHNQIYTHHCGASL